MFSPLLGAGYMYSLRTNNYLEKYSGDVSNQLGGALVLVVMLNDWRYAHI